MNSELKPGPGQGYKGKNGRVPNTIVPEGIYCSQFMNTTLGYTNHNYPMVLQVAAPRQYVTKNKEIAVVLEAIPLKIIFPFRNAPR